MGDFNVVALRVEFQADTTRFTTGNGRFDGDPFMGLDPSVDPLPHDDQFFQAHLDALAHYVEHVSDGRASVTTALLPQVVQVSGEMADYTPVGLDATSDEEISKLAALIEEAWTIAAGNSEIRLDHLDPERTFFVLFHAGVGRDIELVGTTLEKTPLDLPSIFFNRSRLQALGVPPLVVGGLEVANTAVIPRTETRVGFDFFADRFFLAELTTNGLIASSFLNFLGLPDLFDTESGESAIGPFGLMDPLGIFAYGGLIPPEPSPWSKAFLGWAHPIDIVPGVDADLRLAAVSTPDSSEMVRVWVSETEYFIVENRHRDLAGDGLRLLARRGDVETEQRVANGDSLFNNRNIEGFSGGVLVAVDDYDWSLPGGLDEDGNPLLGGALLWHVDETLIAQRIGRNAVNASPGSRGVDVEEADSGQDLGTRSTGIIGPQLELGSPFDFFFAGNPVTAITPSGRAVALYANRFGDDTFPNSRTNGGGPSFVSIQDFSAP
ncbi:MAG: hypothetical protein R3282_10865, partial [Rhodothermales bacterium]|nr:hypothetical protein [Rhodothermales bacterium]